MKNLILLTFVIVFFGSCQNKYFEKDLPKLMNVENIEIVNVQTLDEWGGSQGDGFILEVYELSQHTVDSFIKRTYKKLPEKENRESWFKYDWSKVPIDTSYIEIQTMTLNYSASNEKLNKILNEIKTVLNKKETYNAFYYKPNKENPNNVEMFVLDTETNKFYAIDQQL